MKLDRLNHVAIAVPDLAAAQTLYRDRLGAEVSDFVDLPEQGVRTVFVKLGNANVELLAPLGEGSPIANFLERHPGGGIHHVCYEVDDIGAACEDLTKQGMRILGDGKPKIGMHGKPIVFLHPKDFHGTLIELEQA
ncbi:MAG: methylmalonyl-CoA epimerase [Rhodospirillales bacterium]